MHAQHGVQPVEDINAVLSRFQAWTGAHLASKPQEGFREISYEEALKRCRYRRPSYDDLPPIAPKKDAPQASTQEHTLASDAVLEKEKPADTVKVKSRVKQPPKQHSSPEFRELLAKTIETPAEIISVSSTEIAAPRRPASLSVRLATSEQALIKTRAAEAGLSASAYMRQCALEVEQLRKQVEKMLIAAAPIPAPAPLPSIFSRLKRYFLGKHSTGLTVRA